MLRRSGCHVILPLLSAALLIGPDARAQQAATPAHVEAGLAKFKGGPNFEKDSPTQAHDRASFVAGNVLFAIVHEVGHAVISEMGLAVLGREEDAADSFATVLGLKLGGKMSKKVLVESARGWFLSDKRDQEQGQVAAFYDEHGMDKQRAYNIVCIMVGSDPKEFKPLADMTKLPEERQGTCQGDFSNASWSWDKALQPHRRTGDQPKTKIEVSYADPGPRLRPYADAFREMGILELVAQHLEDDFIWRRPIKLEMTKCGEPSAHWDLASQKIIVCYELAEDFAQLYNFSSPSTPKAKPTKAKRKKAASR